MPNDTQLLCTFCTKETLEKTIEEIVKTYTIVFDSIYVLSNVDVPEALCCTYNINTKSFLPENAPEATISLHRKKISNTLYTINALNLLISSLNNGKVDKNFQINWSDYKNTILVTAYGKLKIIKTQLETIIKL